MIIDGTFTFISIIFGKLQKKNGKHIHERIDEEIKKGQERLGAFGKVDQIRK